MDQLTGMDAGEIWRQLREHTNDPETGECPKCCRRDCSAYGYARETLLQAGLLMPEAQPR